MSTKLTISTSKLKAAGLITDASDFSFQFNTPIILPDLNYEVCLRYVGTWLTFHNLFAGETNTMTWADGTQTSTITIPPGNYGVSDLNLLLHNDMYANGAYDSSTGLFGINLQANVNTNKADCIIDNSVLSRTYTIQFSDSVSKLLGFANGITISTNQTSTLVPEVTNGIDTFTVRCDLIRNSYDNGGVSDILYSFQPTAPPSARLTVEPKHLFYSQVNKTIITGMTLKLTDQNNNKIDLQGEDIVYVLEIRRINQN